MRSLLVDIVHGGIAPGGDALREADIATRFGVSRGVARECVRGLEERGLVSVKPGRGATVNPPERWTVFDPDVVSALLGAGRGRELLGQYLECRRILEVEAVALAAERATDDDRAALAERLARLEASARQASLHPAVADPYQQAEVALHESLVAATHNAALAAMLAPLWRAVAAVSGPAPAPEPERAIAAHRRIVEAVAARNASAARAAMRDHLVAVERDLYASSDGPGHPGGVGEHRAA